MYFTDLPLELQYMIIFDTDYKCIQLMSITCTNINSLVKNTKISSPNSNTMYMWQKAVLRDMEKLKYNVSRIYPIETTYILESYKNMISFICSFSNISNCYRMINMGIIRTIHCDIMSIDLCSNSTESTWLSIWNYHKNANEMGVHTKTVCDFYKLLNMYDIYFKQNKWNYLKVLSYKLV